MARFVTSIVLVICFSKILNGFPTKKEASCEIKYHKIGCYNDFHKNVRPLPLMLFTDRDESDPKYSGVHLDWENWDSYVNGLACRCAEAAAEKGFKLFGLQYYGECWSNNKLSFSFNTDGGTDKCVERKFKPCDSIKSDVCVGKDNAIFVYNV